MDGEALKEDFDWGDGWDEPAGEVQVVDQQRSPERAVRTSGPKSPSAPVRGLASMDTNASSSWVGSVGKKWGEIKGSST